MSPVEAFAIGIKSFDRQKVCLIAWSSLLNLLILFLRVKGQIKAVHSWSFDFYILEVTLIPWSALKKGWLDSILIPLGTYKWLLLEVQDAQTFSGCIVKTRYEQEFSLETVLHYMCLSFCSLQVNMWYQETSLCDRGEPPFILDWT